MSSPLPSVAEEPLQEGTDGFGREKLAAIRALDVDPANARFMLLVEDFLRAESLPRGWSAAFDKKQDQWQFKDKAGVLHARHPVHDYYTGAMFMDQGGYAQLKAIALQRPPGRDEVQQMGAYFSIKPDEDPYIWEVAEMGLCAPLPPMWAEVVAQERGEAALSVSFKHEGSGEVQVEHPLDNYFRELIRRRRRELLRRKRAALTSLQALVKMGMGRRSRMAAAAAAAAAAAGTSSSSSSQEQQDAEEEAESLDAATQSSLHTAWHGLLGSAAQLVQCMQAAVWDNSSSDSPGGAAPSSGDAAAAAAAQPEFAYAQRLQQLAASLASALGPSAQPDKAAAAALTGIQGLAALTAAAGSSAAQLTAILTAQGVDVARFFEAAAGDDDAARSGADNDALLMQSAAGTSGSSCSRRPRSLTGGDTADDGSGVGPRRNSFLGAALPFVGADGGSSSGAGTSSSGGRSSSVIDPWSLAGGKPDAAAMAAAASARSHAAAQAAGAPGDAAAGFAAAGSSSVHPAEAAAAAAAVGSSETPATATAARSQPGAAAVPSCSYASPVYASEFPPAAQAALQHLASLQAVVGEALLLIQSWQQQRVIIALLQQRLQDSAAQALACRRRLAGAEACNAELQAEQARQRASAAGCAEQCRLLLEQLVQAQGALAAADACKGHLQQQVDTVTAELQSRQQLLDQLQADKAIDAGNADAQSVAAQAAHTQLQQTIRTLQEQLEAQTAAAAAAQASVQHLEQQLAVASTQLEQEQAEKAAVQQQLLECQEAVRALQASHAEQLASSGTDAEAAGAALQRLQELLQIATAERDALQQELTAAQATAAGTLQQQQELQAQLQRVHEQLSGLQGAHSALQLQHEQQGARLQETEAQLRELRAQHGQRGADIIKAQQALLEMQGQHASALTEQQRLQGERQQLLQAQGSLQGSLASTQADVAAMQAAARAAEQRRASMPHRGCQVSAAEHAEQHWVHSRGVQTGDELDPRSKRDVGTPADLSLLSYFFREIKAKQRGGGGAILGYDPAQAAHAAEVAAHPASAKSWSGAAALPPISGSTAGGLTKAQSAALPKRPATMPGSLPPRPRISNGALKPRQLEEPEEETGGFDSRPPHPEVRQRVDRRRDRQIRLESGKPESGADKWDYALDQRDAEIAELKSRLVEADHRAKQAADKAAEDAAAAASELQACKRRLEQAHAESCTLNNELVGLKLAVEAVQLADGSGSSSGGSALPARISSAFAAASLAAFQQQQQQPRSSTAHARMSSHAPSGFGGGSSGGGPRDSVALLSLSGGGGGAPGGSVLSGSGGGGGGAARGVLLYSAGRLSSLPNSLAGSAAAKRKSVVAAPPDA